MITRRGFLEGSAAAATLPLWAACASDDGGDAPIPTYSYDGAIGPADLFAHGVASGDPLADRVVLWTRVSLKDAEAAAVSEIAVFWEVARDAAFADRVAAGEGPARKDADWTFKVDADGLAPATSYYYRFWLQGRSSPIGRTRTLPVKAVDRIRLGVCSCASFGSGYFVAYRALAARADLDAVLHLGDYIYEYAGKPGSERYAAPDHELLTLDDYRQRYRAHRGDADLQAVHRQHPFICVWDDHETANNAWSGGSPSHDEATEGAYDARKAAAQQAWREWIPARVGDDGKIWRKLAYGDLIDLWMLDTRLWGRSKQTTPSKKDVIADPERSFLGPDQEAWLLEGLASSKARWLVLGQQVMIGRLGIGATVLNTDQWDGYGATRDRLFAAVRARGVGSFVVLTGDIHSSWANDLVEDSSEGKGYDAATGEGALGVEFVVPGITSGGLPGGAGPDVAKLALDYNPHIRWNDVVHRGYGVLDVDDQRCHFDWYHFASVESSDAVEAHGAAWQSAHGSGHLDPATGPAPARAGVAALAP